MKLVTLIALGLGASSALAAEPGRHTLVFCAPGSPGSTAEAQPTMDALAAALTAKARLPATALGAVYEDAEDSGVARLRAKDAAIAVVSLPFYLKRGQDLALRARLQVVPQGRGEMERWALVAKRGRVPDATALDGFTISSVAGFAPGFVRGPALGGWGKIPAGARIVQSGAVLSALRRAVAGEPVAVLLDGAQEEALASLPFASELEVVAHSPLLPAAVVAAVDARLSAKAWSAIEGALQAMPSDPQGAAALDGIRTTRFVAVDEKALAAARKAYEKALR